MNAEVFVDTNVFLYSISDQPEEHVKAERARDLLLTESWGWSVQVAGEFFHTATSPGRQFRIPADQAVEFVKTWLDFPTASLTPSTVLRALEIRKRFQISYWDAAIIAAAIELGCHTIHTEDLNHGQDYGGVKALNPFLDQTSGK
jgi:predicted nucleic acid-binding protein